MVLSSLGCTVGKLGVSSLTKDEFVKLDERFCESVNPLRLMTRIVPHVPGNGHIGRSKDSV
eukprot:scaffold376_cov156-Amphora_coffeaeformis.AAC.3